MPAVLFFKALSYGLIGLLAITFLALCLISLAKEAHAGEPASGIFPFAVVIAVLCVLLALFTGYVRINRTASITLWLDRIAIATGE